MLAEAYVAPLIQDQIVKSIEEPRQVLDPNEIIRGRKCANEKSAENHKRNDERRGKSVGSFQIWRERGDEKSNSGGGKGDQEHVEVGVEEDQPRGIQAEHAIRDAD